MKFEFVRLKMFLLLFNAGTFISIENAHQNETGKLIAIGNSSVNRKKNLLKDLMVCKN